MNDTPFMLPTRKSSSTYTLVDGFTQEDYDKRLRRLSAQTKNRHRFVPQSRQLKTVGARAKAMLALAKAHDKTADLLERRREYSSAKIEREYARQYRENATELLKKK